MRSARSLRSMHSIVPPPPTPVSSENEDETGQFTSETGAATYGFGNTTYVRSYGVRSARHFSPADYRAAQAHRIGSHVENESYYTARRHVRKDLKQIRAIERSESWARSGQKWVADRQARVGVTVERQLKVARREQAKMRRRLDSHRRDFESKVSRYRPFHRSVGGRCSMRQCKHC
jgi:hypothetical protein